MRKSPKQTEYLYATARFRALEAGLVGKDRIEQLADAANAAEIFARLEEFGVAIVRDASGEVLAEQTLLGVLQAALDNIYESAPAPELYDFLKYPYDCNNVKVAIKCYLRHVSADGMLFDFGTVSAKDVEKMPAEGNFSALPAAMAAAAPQAIAAYEKTANPRMIDLILDKACFADMLACVKCGGDPLHLQLLGTQIDLVNAMICLRLVRMGGGEQARVLLEDAMIEGGTLSLQALLSAFEGGESALYDLLAHSGYDKLVQAIKESDGSLAAAERAVDDYRMALVRTVRYTPFGASVLTAYFYAQEYAVKNVRIILAAKSAGLSPQTIRERIRTSYV